MAPNKKKKKTSANPQRGFATTSQPSRSKMIDTTVQGGPSSEIVAEDAHVREVAISTTEPLQAEQTLQDMTPGELEAHLEQSELQQILDSYGARCRQDAINQISKLNNERRQLRSQDQSDRLASSTWLDEETINDIIRQCQEYDETQNITVYNDTDPSDDNSLLLHIWVLHRTLSGLELPSIEVVVMHTLELGLQNQITKTEYIWGLAEALEWYALQCPQATLPSYDTGKVSSLPEKLSAPQPTDDAAPAFQNQIKTESFASTPEIAETISNGDDPIYDLSPLVSSNSEDEDPDAFVGLYLRLKKSLFRTEQAMKSKSTKALSSRKATLVNRIQKLTRDPLFDIDLAKSYWRSQEWELEKEVAQAEKVRQQRDSGVEKGSEDVDNIEDEHGLFGDVFEALEDSQQESTNIEERSIIVLDFGKWTGAQPRKLLEESCKSVDAQADIRFFALSTTLGSCRQSLQLTMSGGILFDETALKSIPEGVAHCAREGYLKLEMLAIAVSNPVQAESYLSCIVLFLISVSNLSDRKQYSRLPTIWRAFYQELLDRRKCLNDEADRHVLAQLRTMIDGAKKAGENSGRKGSTNEICSTEKSSIATEQNKSRSVMDENRTKEVWKNKSSTLLFDKLLQQRKLLPIHHFKHEILEMINQNQLTIICADTGAGKSTQIPTFILEQEMSNGRDCRILVTQPRRISAISLARRVSQELGEANTDLGTARSLVGYAIRLESKTSHSTRITFATTGVLLRMLESDPELRQISCLVLDEVHERTMDLDLLFIAIIRLQQRRRDLRIILMSATVDASKFSKYFHGAPIVDVPGRTFPVEVKYLEDAIEATLDQRKNNPQHQITSMKHESDSSEDVRTQFSDVQTPQLQNYSAKTRSILAEMDHYRVDLGLIADLVSAIATQPQFLKYSKAILIFLPGIAEIKRLQNIFLSRDAFSSGWVIHLLHSSFSTDDLERAFAIPKHNYRKIVISTNIAETGITIPDVTAVIDSCKEKVMRFNERRQISRLTEGFISRSSARQRKGRAARVQDGLCFHLVTKARYDNIMLEQHVPEMLRLSLQEAILRVKIWDLGPIEETLSSAIDPPLSKNVRRAIDRLREAGALDLKDELTPLGKLLSRLPLEVVLGKMAVFSVVFKCLDAIITIIAALGSKSPFVIDRGDQHTNPRLAFSRGNSDLISTLNAYRGWHKAREAGIAHQFCRKHGLNDSNLGAIEDQKVQLLVYLVEAGLLHLDDVERAALHKSRSSYRGRQAFQIPARYNQHEQDPVLCAVIALATYPRILRREGKGWRNVYTNQRVSLTSNSVVNQQPQDATARWTSFYEAVQARSGALNVLEASAIPDAALAILVGNASFKFYSGVMVLDHGKIKLSLSYWRQLATLKLLRARLTAITERCWLTPRLGMTAKDEKLLESVVQMLVGQGNTTR